MVFQKKYICLIFLYSLLVTLPVCAEVLTDPTRPPVKKAVVPILKEKSFQHVWDLESTLVSSERKVAVINGKLLTIGDYIDGARVISIRKNRVVVKASHKEVTLLMLPDIVKKK